MNTSKDTKQKAMQPMLRKDKIRIAITLFLIAFFIFIFCLLQYSSYQFKTKGIETKGVIYERQIRAKDICIRSYFRAGNITYSASSLVRNYEHTNNIEFHVGDSVIIRYQSDNPDNCSILSRKSVENWPSIYKNNNPPKTDLWAW